MLDGWGANKNGIPTRNPDDVLNGGGLVPLGCYEETGKTTRRF
jgi:LDH2 family malate/lactate/ureidoglycolate dehydrogenase